MSQKLDAGGSVPWRLFSDQCRRCKKKLTCRLVQTSADQCRRCKKVPQDTRCSAYNASSPSSQRDHGAKQSKTMTGHQTLIARSDNGGTYVRSRLGLRRKNDEEDLRQGSLEASPEVSYFSAPTSLSVLTWLRIGQDM